MASAAELIGWRERRSAKPPVKPWKPQPLAHDQWPPDYDAVFAWRIRTLKQLRSNPRALAGARKYYSTRPSEFIMHWLDTYDPRKTSQRWIPFVFFARQEEYIEYLHSLRRDQEGGLVEKARDMGATWLSCGYSVWSWLFIDNDAIGWGSRKQELVDKLGEPDSIFEKIRLMIQRLPDIWRPIGLVPKKHLTFMKCINPANGSVIAGEAGDNIGRGGRKSMFLVDEAAHIERPEKVESALGDNTRVRVDISSVNGLGNPFHRRREAGIDWHRGAVIEAGFTRVFVMDWRDHPEKDQNWYDTRKARYEREGLSHVFAQEVDRNYSAAVSNTVIPMEYIQAAVDAHLLFAPGGVPDTWVAGLDIADDGADRNGLCARQWVICRHVEEWGDRDVGVTTRRALVAVRDRPGIRVMYDSVGLGAGVKSEYNRITIDEQITNVPRFVPWNAGAGVLNPLANIIPNDPSSMTNFASFQNIKAQAWWSLRTRFYKTWVYVTAIRNGKTPPNYEPDEMISLDSSMPLLYQLMKELTQPTFSSGAGLKMVVDKAPKGMRSPNLADAVVMAFFPIPDNYSTVIVGTYG